MTRFVERRHRFVPPDPAEVAARARTLSGLELMRAILKGDLPNGPMLDLIGAVLVEAAPGRVAFEAATDAAFANPAGALHGGFAATLLDSALGCAIHTRVAAGFGYGTVDLNVKYVRPLLPGTGRVRATGEAVHAGRTMATSEARLTGVADGRLYAHGTTTCLIYPLSGG